MGCDRLKGKTVLASASGAGIGRASALAMAAEGATVHATDINEDLLASLAAEAEGDLRTFRLDVLDDAAVADAVAATRPDVLFNCAGFVHSNTVVSCTDDEWDFAFALNVRAMHKMMQAAVPVMLEKGAGSIINMSSAASSIIGAPNRYVYGATKAAVLGMTKAVAREYIARGVRCNAICPGTVDSPSLHDRLRATGDYERALAEFTARQPMGRIASAGEIAALVVYLASDESGFTTGQGHVIDGGWSG